MDTLISVIIPVYHVKPMYVKRCIDSVLHQTIQTDEIEVILVLDGMHEEYHALKEQYGKRVHWIIKEHEGVSAARNRGIEEASGKWILFLDADDWLSKDCFQFFEKTLLETSKSIIMFNMVREYAEGGSKEQTATDPDETIKKINKERFMKDAFSPQTGVGYAWGKFFDRMVLKENHLHFQQQLSMAEDAEFVIRAIPKYETILYTSRQFYHYWFNPDSAVRRYRKNYAQSYIDSMSCIQAYVEQEMPQYKVECDNFILYHLLLIAINDCFHPEHPGTVIDQINDLKEKVQLPIFKNALKNLRLNQFSLTRKIAILCIYCHFWIGIAIIAKIRHRQFGASKNKKM